MIEGEAERKSYSYRKQRYSVKRDGSRCHRQTETQTETQTARQSDFQNKHQSSQSRPGRHSFLWCQAMWPRSSLRNWSTIQTYVNTANTPKVGLCVSVCECVLFSPSFGVFMCDVCAHAEKMGMDMCFRPISACRVSEMCVGMWTIWTSMTEQTTGFTPVVTY